MQNKRSVQIQVPIRLNWKKIHLSKSDFLQNLDLFCKNYHHLPQLINISFVSKKKSQEINYKYRKIKQPTDVLCFKLKGPIRDVGDVYICPAIARQNANSLNKSLGEEIIFLAKHAIKHLEGIHHR